MTAEDLDLAIELWRQTEGVGLNESDAPDSLLAYLRRNPGLSLVVRHDAQIVGTVLCGHDGRRGYLHHLAVVPEFRQQGLGKLLVSACLKSLATLGIQRCNIFLYVDNDSGARFWNRLGWASRNDLTVLQRATG